MGTDMRNEEVSSAGRRHAEVVVVLGMGGTIAGLAPGPDDRIYRAAQIGVADLVATVPVSTGRAQLVEAVQVAQVDSKDMGWPVWRDLLASLAGVLARPDVAGVVITHGTDTLEETACLLHWLLPPGKPVVLTAAMRPANSPHADGPGNLRDAMRVVRLASEAGYSGVVAVMNGTVWAGRDVRKSHTSHVDAFDGGGAPPLGQIDEEGRHSLFSAWPQPLGWMTHALLTMPMLPDVEIVVSHADADGRLVRAILESPTMQGQALRGLVVAGTGGGTVHEKLEQALGEAVARGVVVWRSSRVARGGVAARDGERWPAAGPFTAAQARVGLALLLALERPPTPQLLSEAG